jgi:hypothetical protein
MYFLNSFLVVKMSKKKSNLEYLILAGLGVGIGYLIYKSVKPVADSSSGAIGETVKSLSAITSPQIISEKIESIKEISVPVTLEKYIPTNLSSGIEQLKTTISQPLNLVRNVISPTKEQVTEQLLPLTQAVSPLSVAGFQATQDYGTKAIEYYQNVYLKTASKTEQVVAPAILAGAYLTRDFTLNLSKALLGVPVTVAQSAGAVANAVSNVGTNIRNAVTGFTSIFGR